MFSTRTITGAVGAITALAMPLTMHAQIAKPAAVTAASRPPVPTQVTAKLTAPGEITVSWAAVADAARYTVTRLAPPEALHPVSPAGFNATTFVDKNLKPGSRHTYFVVAINAANQSSLTARSNVVDVPAANAPVATPAGTPAGAPTAGAPAVRTETREQLAQRAYMEGMKRFAGKSSPDNAAWKRAAVKSGLSFDQLVEGYVPLAYSIIIYKHVLQTEPDSAMVVHFVTAMKSGTTWQSLWKEIAQSRAREEKFGFWAPAPIASLADARQVFGLASISHPEQCFGGLGDRCEGGIPLQVNNQVQPRWKDMFTLPDGTQMGYVDIGVAVGSIMHDNACIRDINGLYCNGVNAGAMVGDLVKTGGPAANEWNKASWNVIDHRTWRTTFGPYPVDKNVRLASWYDDVRPANAREGWMAPAVGMFTTPDQSIRWTGGETRRSQTLAAPTGTKLDVKDVAFCQSKTFVKIDTPIGKAPMGTCR